MFWLLVIVIQWQMLDTQNSFLKDNSGKGEGHFHQDHPQANPLHRVSSMISECKPVNNQNHRVMKWINTVAFSIVGGSINIFYQTQTDLCMMLTTIKMQRICKSRLLFRYIIGSKYGVSHNKKTYYESTHNWFIINNISNH